LVVAKMMERLAVCKRPVNRMDMDIFNLKKLNEGEVKEQYQVTIKNIYLVYIYGPVNEYEA
jgi:hypothetical protein